MSSPLLRAQDAEPLELGCLLEPSMTVELGPTVPGVLSAVNVDRGDVVKKNEALAEIDARIERAQVELARARSEFAERRIQRSKELYEGDLMSGQERDELETEKQLAELELTEKRAQVEMRTIRSPIDGFVVERVRAQGEYVRETEILILAKIDPLNVEVVVPVQFYGRIRSGMEAEVVPEAPMDNVYKAAVKVVDKSIDAASSTFGVRLQIPNEDLAIPAGLKCSVTFHLN